MGRGEEGGDEGDVPLGLGGMAHPAQGAVLLPLPGAPLVDVEGRKEESSTPPPVEAEGREDGEAKGLRTVRGVGAGFITGRGAAGESRKLLKGAE